MEILLVALVVQALNIILFVVWNEGPLRIVLNEYVHGWYSNSRVHQGIHGIPDPDPVLAKL